MLPNYLNIIIIIIFSISFLWIIKLILKELFTGIAFTKDIEYLKQNSPS